MEDQAKLYCTLMEDAKQRLALVRQLVEGSISTTRTEFDTELACLSLRRVLELIAFSSLAANKAEYELHYPEFDIHWKAEKILLKLALVNPDFYPVPVTTEGNNHLSPSTKECLSKEQFSFLYNKCSDVIHTWNPYRKEPRTVNFERPLGEWAELIWNLLGVHYLTIAKSDTKFIVQMHHPSDNLVHVYVAAPKK